MARSTSARIQRHFTAPGLHPYETVGWERRDARITNWRTGDVAFEQRDVEVPVTWSQNATNILAQKYFRGHLGTPEREGSLRQVVDRIVNRIVAWGEADGYFADDDERDAFADELRWLLVHQRAAFNSPVWFNIGVEGVPQQASACFILSVDDTMESILNWYHEEGIIFKGGSGAGVNLSTIRSSVEPLAGGGTASGPVSFMRGADASAGTIKSGGKTRRAAKMVILNVDHPDVEEFVWTKAIEERKARVLAEAGFDMGVDGKDAFSIQYQNANNSVRVTDEFMQAVVEDREWELRAVTTGEVTKTVRARDLFHQIAEAAWECADPGLQFDTTINRWHTTPNAGRINGSNPCFPGSARVHTNKGLIAFEELTRRVLDGEEFLVYTHDSTSPDDPTEQVLLSSPEAFMVTGYNQVVKLRFDNGAELRCTPGHRIFTVNRGYVAAEDLTPEDEVQLLDLPAPATDASWVLPVATDPEFYHHKGDRRDPMTFPERWSEDFAHFLGWLIGDGSLSNGTVVATYGSPDDQQEILPIHQQLLLEINGNRPLKVSTQANGTVQLRFGRQRFMRFLEALGMKRAKGPDKDVPWAIEQAPAEIVGAFLRGLFDADGTVIVDRNKGSYVSLGSISTGLLRSVQRLLTTFGITSRIYKTRSGSSNGSFSYTGRDGDVRVYPNHDAYQLRITSASIVRFAEHVGFGLGAKQARLRDIVGGQQSYEVRRTARLTERLEDGIELTYNLSEPKNHSYIVDGIVVRNCSEYMHLDNSSCNLASINLLAYLDEDGNFDVEGFRHTARVLITAQDILAGNADYPTPRIAETSRAYRQLGLGYANLGAMLMALGLPYDSDGGRAYAAAVTALMTGAAYERSAELAERLGPFAGYADDAESMLRVLGMHRDALAKVDGAPEAIVEAARASWDMAIARASEVGVRNAQASLLAPTGTIGFLMDCDTTGIEPDFSLVKYKTLVGGGTMKIVNQTVPRALRTLGYPEHEIDQITAYLAEHDSIVGAPGLKPEHEAVFACAVGEYPISPTGHLAMMGAVQPFLSGAISKTVNLPSTSTVEDVEQTYLDAWRLGIKAVALYRDGSKVGQPLSTTHEEDSEAITSLKEQLSELERQLAASRTRPVRERLPRHRRSRTYAFQVADAEGYVTVGEYDDGRPGEVFVKVSKQGSTLAGVMDAFSIAVSLGLQHGVPLETFVRKYVNMRFEPAGMTDDPDVRIASSLVDYIFRRLAIDYLPREVREDLGVLTTAERRTELLFPVEEVSEPTTRASAQTYSQAEHRLDSGRDDVVHETATRESGLHVSASASDAPYCFSCGNVMQRSGSCYVCPACGTTSGCS
ncbi:ribonucleoside-diphosphate reductase, adenosylcobalamin-dependent [Acidimicrobium ferrooxidans DSM 10331]|uniref:Vitamin B12-dependent ribonucleotide reductase n=1 Tax=Acidimicrobium ferrooxidans (strain DSM 10331 / JCM 15462 / NBRC 103882 / ICP) TaxID=525909 RepID=C7LZ05_ACIFD|nr:LAGLIDADG family homing endonuclease [Acidimicrobium ferrooxidans]ACU53963.1 ribonucleoside-diphosphate reductase, adenosylcobalamin-dependent [Acidimicrobium ferrooxidans DSM 10331]